MRTTAGGWANGCAVHSCASEPAWRLEFTTSNPRTLGVLTTEVLSCRAHVDEIRTMVTPYAVTRIERDSLAPVGVVVDEVRRPGHEPTRGSDVEAWIKEYRDRFGDAPAYARAKLAIDGLLDDYRDHADTGVPLDQPVHGPHSEVTS